MADWRLWLKTLEAYKKYFSREHGMKDAMLYRKIAALRKLGDRPFLV
jgi:hypothetical protein